MHTDTTEPEPTRPAVTETRMLHGMRGSVVGRVDPTTGRLYTTAGNLSLPGGTSHARRRQAAERLGIAMSPEVTAMEARNLGHRRAMGTLRQQAVLTRGPDR